MSGGISCLELSKDDVRLMLAAGTFLGTCNCNFQMANYVFARNKNGNYIIKLNRVWEKIILAARAIAAVENPADVIAVGLKPNTQRAVLKFAQYTGCTAVAGRFTPGAFTNQIQSGFKQPRLLVVSDPLSDHQPIIDASCVNVPVIAFCNTDSPLKLVDIAIPCNNIVSWWMLAREVRRIKGKDSRSQPWDIMVDLFIHRESNEEKDVETKTPYEDTRTQQTTAPADTEGVENWPHESLMIGTGAAELANTGMTTGGYGRVPGAVGGDWGDYEDSRPW
ncbi:unnamed protein product [Protopolystoma xenopodis]|uniref:Small ribosomal subunit protein uS2 n=1 Tax=Protopolystoma xenopodis TaxID=117903 RepID=A0A3S5CPQ8_9PLAT|nr:unnamed protein product [Protopolystoma xenopodis]